MIHNLAADARGFTSNAYLIEGERPTLVDVGNEFDVVSSVRERVGDLDLVALTHTHPDHVGNLPAVREAFDAPVVGFDATRGAIDREIADGETIAMGDHGYVALHTPGHKDDHLCFSAATAGVLFAGDLVFDGGSFGRTDLAEGDRATLIDSIDRVLETVDEDLSVIHPGHGPSITGDPHGQLELARRMATQ